MIFTYLYGQADEVWTRLLIEADQPATDTIPDEHRQLMAHIKAAVVAAPLEETDDQRRSVAAVRYWLGQLEQLQGPDGLFSSSGNISSPPDSAFTVGDLVITMKLLRLPENDLWREELSDRLEELLLRALPAMIRGGIHTPNHRWEISSALAAGGELVGERTALTRANEWLREGIDVDDGIYSERSANYAAYVSNPSLLTLAALPGREDYLEAVRDNLHAILDLSTPAGQTETIYSRRQDQKDSGFWLGPFAGQFARFAVDDARFAAAAAWALTLPGVDPISVLAEAALEPSVAEGLAAADPWFAGKGSQAVVRALGSGTRYFDAVRLWRHRDDRGWVVGYGGSDVPQTGRIASGLACNPTFLRLCWGGVEVASVRLSREFFGLGPLRAQSLEETENGFVLRESVSAHYYQPLPDAALHRDGVYPLQFEGRYAAAMAFDQRRSDRIELSTTVWVTVKDDQLQLTVTTTGAQTEHCLELGLAGAAVEGATDLGRDRYALGTEPAIVVAEGGGRLAVAVSPGSPTDSSFFLYQPGEAYDFLGGSDAVDGTRLYFSWVSPATVTLTFRPAVGPAFDKESA